MSGKVEMKRTDVERAVWERPELRRLDAADAQANAGAGHDGGSLKVAAVAS